MTTQLRESRLVARMTQEQAAEALGVSRRTLGDYEKGRTFPDVRVIERMTRVYGVSADQLIGCKPLIAKD